MLYEKPHSVVQCDYVWRRTDLWINFPWSDTGADRVRADQPRKITVGGVAPAAPHTPAPGRSPRR